MPLADVLTSAGINYAPTVIAECARYGIPVAVACVLLVKETGGGRNIFGHDDGACMSVKGEDIEVTELKYKEYLTCVQAGGKRNGVGPMQLTWSGYQIRADQLGGCHKPEVNIRVGVEAIAEHLENTNDLWESFRRYNGKASYADDAVSRLPHWLGVTGEPMPTLVIQMGHVGRPPCPGSVGTSGEQDFTRRAAQTCARLLNRDGWVVKVIDADPNYSAVPKLGGNPEYYRGDAFVAIHCDGSTNPIRDGGSFGYKTGGQGFARDIKANYAKRTGRDMAWFEPDNYTTNLSQYYGLGLAAGVGNTRAVIMECGFLTNPTDREMLLAETGPVNVALAIGDALGMNLPEVDVTTPGAVWGHELTAASGYKTTAAGWLIGTNNKAEQARDSANLANAKLDALGPVLARIEAKLDQHIASGGSVSPEDVEAIKAAAEVAAREGAREGVSGDVLAELHALEDRLQADDKEQAVHGGLEALGRLREVLAPTTPDEGA